jgi:N-acetylmuramoyl-L-alanine amidase
MLAFRAFADGPARIDVVLDPGHTPSSGGAMSARGIKEVGYNDRLASILADTLAAHGLRVLLTRRPGEEVSLADRVAVAAKSGARCFIALHHDSAQPRYLERIDTAIADVYATRRPIRGYSLFVSTKNPAYPAALPLARALGSAILKLGRKPTLHHAEPIPGENRPLLDSAIGLYRYDDLVVLARNPLPAVLIEFGVLPDRVDEAYVSDEGNQARFAQAVSKVIEDYCKQ